MSISTRARRNYLHACALLAAGLLIGMITPPLQGQQPVQPAPITPGTAAQGATIEPQKLETIQQSYQLGAADQIQVRVSDVEEIVPGPYTIDSDGMISLPLLGKVRAAGLTVEALEADLRARLSTYVRQPKVAVSVTQFRSEPVFFVGAFRAPGIYPLHGRRTLIEMITSIGGLATNANRRIRITRRLEFGTIPLPNVTVDSINQVSWVELGLGTFRDNINPAENIALQKFDVVAAERAEMVYVTGEVSRVGGIELGERPFISVSQLIAMSGGLTREASPERARLLRPILNTTRRAEIPVDLRKILSGEANDLPLMPNDMLFVPRSSDTARAAWRTVLIAVPAVSTLVFLFR